METKPSLDHLRTIYKEIEKDALKDFMTFLSFPSISSEKERAQDLKNCALWLQEWLKKANLDAEMWEGDAPPVIFASTKNFNPHFPTILLYHHYDVQPIDPESAWKSPPFSPRVDQNTVFARGAQDNKGQCFYTLVAIKTLLEKFERLPLNIKILIEGQEEIGSPGLQKLLSSKRTSLKSDYLVIVDVGIPSPARPAITVGVRGILTMDIEVEGPKIDLHSGAHGGLIQNPIHVLVDLLANLRDMETGQIKVKGFYEDILPLRESEKESISWNFDESHYQQETGVLPFGGERAYSPLERNWIRPLLEINGILGGYTGPGIKTVIPQKASCKLSCRLVANQKPEKIALAIKEHLEACARKGAKVKVNIHPGMGDPVRADLDSTLVQAFSSSYSEVFGTPCEKILEGASIPIAANLKAVSQAELIFVGLGLISDQIHAPNEHFSLDRFEKGFYTIIIALYNLSQLSTH